MKRTVLAAALFAIAAFARGAEGAGRAPQYAVDVKIAPAGDAAARVYRAEVTVKDLATGETVFAPHLEVMAGKANVASSTDEKGRDYSLSVSVEGEGKEARYSLQIRDGETLIASQKASVKLR